MEHAKSPDWIPSGWIEQLKVTGGRKVKYYYNIETGQKFFSKKDLVQYVERANLYCDSLQQTSKLDETSSEPMPEHRDRSVRSKKTKSSETVDNDMSSEPIPEHNEIMSEPMPDHEERSSEPMPPATKAVENPEWLPQGWIMEVKAQGNGSREKKCYVDQVTGRKFYSKPRVFDYLKAAQLDSSTSQQKKMGNDSVSNTSVGELAGGKTSLNLKGSHNMKTLEGTRGSFKPKQRGFGLKLGEKVVIERFTPDGLPPGWIKEIKIETKLTGIRKDPYYTDPLSGFVFRSRQDALRYLETGDITTCAMKPKKREELSFLNGETPVNNYNSIETAQKFFSKKDLVQHVERANPCHDSPQQTSKPDEMSSELMPEHSRRRSVRSKKLKSSETGDNEIRSEPVPEHDEIRSDPMPEHNEIMSEPMSDHEERCSDPMPLAMKADETPEWLPQGSIMEVKAQGNGSRRKKTSVGELAGGKTSLNLKGSHNMKTLEGTRGSSKPKQRGLGLKFGEKVVIERFTPDGLPPGWIKEIKIETKLTGIRKDPYYTDPLSGFVFRSRQDALRYLETGDITTCAIKPKKREELSFLNGETSVNNYNNIETGQKFFSKKDLVQHVERCHDSPQQTSKLDEMSSEPMPEHSRRRSVRSKKPKSSETGDNEMRSEPLPEHDEMRSEPVSEDDEMRSEPMPEHNEIMSEPMSDHEEKCSEPMPLAMKAEETPEWLPQRWIMEVKAHGNGSRKRKCYIDQVTGRKFYSKPQVFEFLKAAKLDISTSTPQQKKMGNGSVSKGTAGSSKTKQRGLGLKLEEKVVIEQFTPDGLPPGWIKEIKIETKLTGIRKDPYYTDPLSGLVFFSHRDALRYLETGDITTCAIKPKKREELSFLNGETSVNNYNNIESGHKFFSKKDLVQYAESQQTSKLDEASSEPMPEHSRRRSVRSKKMKSSETGENEMSEPMSEHNEIMSEPLSDHEERNSEPMPLAMKADETSEWLPQGWIMEVKAQGNASRKKRCYIDQVTGRKFYSKQRVFEYLKAVKLDSSTSTSQQKKMGNDSVSNASVGELAGGKTSLNLEGSHNKKTLEGTAAGSSKQKERGFGKNLGEKVVIERFTPDGLPAGWIKEIKIEMRLTGIRKDPFYTDPLSGFVFRSQKDALRYLETGDITTCAMKPKKREELSFLNGETSVNEFQEQ